MEEDTNSSNNIPSSIPPQSNNPASPPVVTEPKPKSRKKWWIIGIVILLLILFTPIHYNQKSHCYGTLGCTEKGWTLGYPLIVYLGVSLLPHSSQTNITRVKSTIQPTTIPAPTTNPTASWKTYQGNGFTFKYPADYVITKSLNPGGDTDILNHNITWHTQPLASNCQGDLCRYSTGQTQITLGKNKFEKVKGYVGSMGGDVPQNYIDYEIPIPNSSEKLVFRINELPADIKFEDLVKQYPDVGRTLNEIPKDQVSTLEQILSTLEFMK